LSSDLAHSFVVVVVPKLQMSNLQIFDFNSQEIRTTIGTDRSIQWCGKDAAVILGYSNTSDALSRHVKDKYKGVSRFTTPSGNQEMVTISTPGLLQLIMSSKLESAEAFQDWVLEIVLPSVLSTGTYKSPEAIHHENWLIARDRSKLISLFFTAECKRYGYNAGYVHNCITTAVTGMTAKELAEHCDRIDGSKKIGLNHIIDIEQLNRVTEIKKAFASATTEELQQERLDRIFKRFGLTE
jgi:prophage antirepressor-like protein